MPRLRNLPVASKLLAVSAAAIAAMMALAAAASLIDQTNDWRFGAYGELASLARVAGSHAAAAAAARDVEGVRARIAQLPATGRVDFVGVYDAGGQPIVTLGDPARAPRPPVSLRPQRRQEGWRAVVASPLTQGRKTVGLIYLESDPDLLRRVVLRDVIGNLGVALALFAVTMLALRAMLKAVVRPMERLTAAIRRVAATSDYSARLPPESDDEFGVLTAAFNSMLAGLQDRDRRLAEQQGALEHLVQERTVQLRSAKRQVERELTNREAAQAALNAHDAMLKAVARGAEALLGSIQLDKGLSVVLDRIGETVAVARVQLWSTSTDQEGHLRLRIRDEWRAPGLDALAGAEGPDGLDLTALAPAMATMVLAGDRVIMSGDGVPEGLRTLLDRAGATSSLFVPIPLDHDIWGGLWFMDTAQKARVWSWAETDTLDTLARLIGVAVARGRFVQDLADANAVVQNSPTVLYRLTGFPQPVLSYVSQNVAQFGRTPGQLLGAPDWLDRLIHPDDRDRLLQTMTGLSAPNASKAIVEFRLLLPTGGYRWVENRIAPRRDEQGRVSQVEGVIVDITERKAAEEQIARLARTDSLTGLANRPTFLEHLHQAFASAHRGGRPFAVLYLDLDHFKDVNDTRGHPMGDRLLKAVAKRLLKRVRESDVVARFGGDEFAILQSDITDPADAGELGADVVKALGDPYRIDHGELHVTASVGIAPFTPQAASPEALLAQADLALYRAKEDGRNQFRFHSQDLDRCVSERVELATTLREGMDSKQFQLVYEPQLDRDSHVLVAQQARLQWRHPTRGLLQEEEFLPPAEASGVVDELAAWALEEVCARMQRWRRKGEAPPAVAVWATYHQLRNPVGYVKLVATTLNRYGLAPSDLQIEVSEDALARLDMARNNVLAQLAQMGVELTLADAGGRTSTYDHLRAYGIKRLKVSPSLLAAHDQARQGEVRAILDTARDMGVQVIGPPGAAPAQAPAEPAAAPRSRKASAVPG